MEARSSETLAESTGPETSGGVSSIRDWIVKKGLSISNLGLLLLATPFCANATELYDLQKVIGQPLATAIEQFPGGITVYSSRPNRPLYKLHDWRGLSLLLFDTEPVQAGLPANEHFLVTSLLLEFSDFHPISPGQAVEFLKCNLGIDVTTGEERFDAKQNSLEYTGVRPQNWTVYFEAYQIPIHLKNGGVELRPDHAEPIKERVAQILIR